MEYLRSLSKLEDKPRLYMIIGLALIVLGLSLYEAATGHHHGASSMHMMTMH